MTTGRSKTAIRLLVGGALAGLIVLGLGLAWFFSGDEPDEVTLDAAVESLSADDDTDAATSADDQTAGDTDDSQSADASGDGIDGVWTVDSETGDFDYESATGSFVGFRIDEELRSIGSTTAVGRTGDVTGSLTIEGTTLTSATFEVDMTTLTTNDTMRDDNVLEAIEATSFPTGSLVLTEPVELGENAASEAVSVEATGDMTIHGVTQPVTLSLDAQLVDGTVVVVGSMNMVFADYGVEVPDGGPVVSVDDFGIVELQLLFTR